MFGISRPTLQSYERQERRTGDLRPQSRTPSNKATLNRPGVRETIRAVFEKQNDATLAEYCVAVEKNCGIRVSLPSMCGYLKQLDLRRKKKTFTHQNVIPKQHNRSMSGFMAT
jgi:transposase